MVSPFYLGRNPEEDAAGQYPGKPISGGSSRYNAPPEFVSLTDDFDAMWDKAAGGLATAITGLPKLYLEEQKNQWRALFKISGGFDSTYVDPDPYARQLSGEAEQFYKASDFEIDLVKLVTDPGSQLKDIFTATYNLQDLRREGKDRLTQALLFGDAAAQNGPLSAKLMDATLSAYKDRFDSSLLRAGAGGNAPHSLNLFAHDPQRVQALYQGNVQPTPQQLNQASIIYHRELKDTIATKAGVAGATKKEVRTDSRSTFGQAYIKYTRVEDTTKNTEAFRGLVNTAGGSMKDIFDDAAGAVGATPTALIHATAIRYAAPGTAQYNQIVTQLQDTMTRFNSMHSVSENLGKMFTGKGAGNLAVSTLTTLDTTRFAPGIPGFPTDFGGLASAKEIDKARAALENMGNSVQKTAQQVHQLRTAYANNLYVSAAERARVERWAVKMDKELKALSGGVDLLNPNTNLGQTWGSLLTATPGSGLTAGQIAERRALAGRLNTFKSRVSGFDVFNTGLHTDLVKIYVDHHILPTRGIDALTSASAIAGNTMFGKQIQMYTLAARDSYKLGHMSNVVTSIQKGKVTSTLFRSRFINALPNYTPQKITKRFLTTNHYWGLKVDEGVYEDYVKWVAMGKPAGQFSVFYRSGNAFVHKLATSKTFGFIFQNKFTIDLGSGFNPISAIGGSHFKAVAQLNLFRQMSANDLHAFISNAGGIQGLQALMAQGLSEKNAFLSLLLQQNSELAFNNLFQHLPFADPGEIYQQIKEFKNWLRKNNFDVFDAAGNFDPNKAQNLDLLLEWFHNRSLNPSYISITRPVVGLVEKLTEKLNVLQDKLYNFSILGFKVGKLFFWQQQATSIVYNRLLSIFNRVVAKISSKFIVGAAGAATGGLALLLAPLLEKLIYFVSASIVGKFSKALSGILRGDFTGLGNAIQYSVQFLVKVIAYTCLVVALLIMFPFLFMNFITSNMSPKAPFAYNNIQTGTVSEVIGDEVVPNACPSKSLSNGVLTQWNPSYTGHESAGHGSNHYWNIIKDFYPSACAFPIPGMDYQGGYGPTPSLEAVDPADNVCGAVIRPDLQTWAASDNYGKAWDVGGSDTESAAGKVICAPALGDVDHWVTGIPTTTGKGTRLELNGFDSSDTLIYKLLLLHLDPATVVAKNKTVEPGDGVGTVWQSTNDAGEADANSHVHLELKDVRNNTVLAPESSGISL
jgi:hypothetical protein